MNLTLKEASILKALRYLAFCDFVKIVLLPRKGPRAYVVLIIAMTEIIKMRLDANYIFVLNTVGKVFWKNF